MIILTGRPNCSYCIQLENTLKKLELPYNKLDLLLEENAKYLAMIREGGYTMPATLIVDGEIYRVSPEQPAKIAQVKAWLEARNVC